MKKILILALAFLLLSVLPAFAAGTEIEIANCNNIAEDLIVTVKTTRNDFTGATIQVGEKITYNLEGEGAGEFNANIELSGLDRAGNVNVVVTANYSGGDSEVFEKTVAIYKMAEEVINFTKANTWLHNVTAGWGGGTGNTTAYNLDEFGNETTDTGSFLFKWKDQDPFVAGDTRVGLQFSPGSNADEGIYYIEHDIYFIYGDEEKIPVPSGVRFMQYYRTETSTTGYPVYTNSTKDPSNDIRGFIAQDSGGKLPNGDQLYTNTWYRVRVVIDKYTKDGAGNYAGGLRYYYAVADEDGNFGDFKLFNSYENVYLSGICGWRYEFKAPDAAFSFAFKNFKFVTLKPKSAWYLEETEIGSDSVKLTFSEDMGVVTTSGFKFFNKLNVDADGNVIYEEVPVSSVEAAGANQYILKLSKTLLYGKDYEIRLANNFTSAEGSIGFKEPAADEDGDGFWNFSTMTAPKYPLNISHLYDEVDGSVVKINNTDIADKYIVVGWYNDEGAMVDRKIKHFVGVPTGDTFVFERNNLKAYTSVKAYVLDLNSDAESKDSGKVTIYDSKEE